ncbi:MAG: hypothetical protein WCJ66_03035 [Verrucomicrobiota bacterium]
MCVIFFTFAASSPKPIRLSHITDLANLARGMVDRYWRWEQTHDA